jgi:hypothetical protein
MSISMRLRRTRRTRLLTIIGFALAALVAGQVWTTAAVAKQHNDDGNTVATGLDNPRGLVFLEDGAFVVAEAGHAGDVCIAPGLCIGFTGQVTLIKSGHDKHTALATKLPSFVGPFGAFGLGDVAKQGKGLAFVVGFNPQAFGNPADDCQGQSDYNHCIAVVSKAQDEAGHLNQLNSHSKNKGWTNLASVGRFDFDYAASHPDPGNPEYAPGDANPFGLAAGPSHGYYVIDAASNTLDFVDAHGQISVLAFIPDPPNHQPIYDAAPTCATVTSNGDVFIGTESNSLWRWHAGHLTKVLSNGKIGQVIGCAADDHGNLYVANLAAKIRGTFPNFNEKPFDGSIVKVTPQLQTSYIATGLNYPTAIALGPHGDLYVPVNGLCPADLSLLNEENSPPGACPEPGKVIRIKLHEHDDD